MNPFGFAYVAGRYSSKIHVYRIEPNGAWTPLNAAYQRIGTLRDPSGDPFYTFLPHPSRRLLYVTGEENIYTFHVKPDGSLAPTRPAFAKISDSLDDASFAASGNVLHITNRSKQDECLLAFRIGATGLPIPIRASKVCSKDEFTFVQAHPAKPFLYTGSKKGINWYRIGETGAVVPVSKAFVTTRGTPGRFLIHPSGKYLFAPASTSCALVRFLIHPSGKYAYVFNFDVGKERANCIEQYRIQESGALQPIPPFYINVPNPYSIRLALHPTGRFLYLQMSGPDEIRRYEVSATGALVAPRNFNAEGICDGKSLLFDRTGKFSYTVSDIDDMESVVRAYVVAPDGVISPNRRVAERTIEIERVADQVVV